MLLIRIQRNERFCNFTSERIYGNSLRFVLKFSNNEPDYKCLKDNKCATWLDLKCKDDVIFKTPCDAATEIQSLKIFVKGFANFFDFLQNLQSSTCSFVHTEIWRKVFHILNDNPNAKIINHNLDQNILHFKFIDT